MTVLTVGATDSEQVVLFAAGGGGDPERHRPLLEHLAARGCRVVAPRFERLASPHPPTRDLLARLLGLLEAVREQVAPGVPVMGVGHSIGGWALLCLAGATPWGRDGTPIDVPREPRLSRLALFAPATGWFAAPGALDHVTVPMLVFVGELDQVTPLAQVRHLKTAPAPVDLRPVPAAGHFAFMNTPPPGTVEDPTFDRGRFLAQLADTTADFLTRKSLTELA